MSIVEKARKNHILQTCLVFNSFKQRVEQKYLQRGYVSATWSPVSDTPPLSCIENSKNADRKSIKEETHVMRSTLSGLTRVVFALSLFPPSECSEGEGPFQSARSRTT